MFLVLILLAVNSIDALAQCAMCRATIENNVSNGDVGIGAGLNFGILYLFVMPYLLIVCVTFLWFRHSKRSNRFR